MCGYLHCLPPVLPSPPPELLSQSLQPTALSSQSPQQPLLPPHLVVMDPGCVGSRGATYLGADFRDAGSWGADAGSDSSGGATAEGTGTGGAVGVGRLSPQKPQRLLQQHR
ncbi:unnamed protein product [Closterium sp. NIES-54]